MPDSVPGNNQPPVPENLPGAAPSTPSSSQPPTRGRVQQPSAFQPRKPEEPSAMEAVTKSNQASPVNTHGSVEDIFSSTDSSANTSPGLQVKTTVGTDAPQSPQSASGQQPNLHEAAHGPIPGAKESLPEIAQDPINNPPIRPLDSHPKNNVFANDKKKFFIIGIAGLIVIVAGFVAYQLVIRNTESEVENQNETAANVPTEQNPSIQDNSPVSPVATQPASNASNEESPVSTQPLLDTDGDGLTDEEEAALGTHAQLPDSDRDGLFDREEVQVYLTDPLNADSDNDGYLDGEEVKAGFDPKGPGQLFDPALLFPESDTTNTSPTLDPQGMFSTMFIPEDFDQCEYQEESLASSPQTIGESLEATLYSVQYECENDSVITVMILDAGSVSVLNQELLMITALGYDESGYTESPDHQMVHVVGSNEFKSYEWGSGQFAIQIADSVNQADTSSFSELLASYVGRYQPDRTVIDDRETL